MWDIFDFLTDCGSICHIRGIQQKKSWRKDAPDNPLSHCFTRSMVYKKHREIQYSSVSKIDLKNQ